MVNFTGFHADRNDTECGVDGSGWGGGERDEKRQNVQQAVKLLDPEAKPPAKVAPGGQTMLLYAERCLAHAPSSDYGPESASRLQVLLSESDGVLRSCEFKDKVRWKHVTEKAAITDVIRVHEYNYIAWLQEQCAKLGQEERSGAAAAGTPMKKEEPHKRLDLDTVITAASYEAAFLAAGAVVEAVDAVLDGQASNAFCVRWAVPTDSIGLLSAIEHGQSTFRTLPRRC